MCPRTILIAAATSCLILGGCAVEEPTAEPNSTEGHLFVDLQDPLAVSWTSQVLVLGPSTGGQHCDDEFGCYGDHRTLERVEVRSSDPAVLLVEEYEVVSRGEIDVLRIDLEAVGEGEAMLEFRFAVEGDDYPPPEEGEDDDPAQQSLQEESSEQQAGGESDDVEADDDRLTDSFSVEAREVSSVRLARILDGVDPQGPFGQCSATDPGLYLMGHLEEYPIYLRMEKIDDRGNRLRGSGRFPFEIEPEGAVEVEEVDEAQHLVKLTPQQFGAVEISPVESGQSFGAVFARTADISSMQTVLHSLSEHGGRTGEATVMHVEQLYEMEIIPDLMSQLPLCGGSLEARVESMTPAICDIIGAVIGTGNPAVRADHGGQCRLRVTLEGAAGGYGLVEDYTYSVEYAF